MAAVLREIELFVAAYEAQSFTGAARRENLTQSGVSQRIRKIETRLGVDLFVREPGVVKPTPAGHAYYRHCLDVLKTHAGAELAMRRFAGSVPDELVVGLMPTMTRATLAPALDEFIRAHPNVALQVIEGYSGELTERVRTGELAFAIVPAVADSRGIRGSHFATSPELLVSANASGLPHLAPIRLAELGPLKIVVPTARNARRQRIETYLTCNDIAVQARLEIDTMFGTLDFVARSDWVAILPGIMMVPDLPGNGLRINTLLDPALSLDLILIEPARRPLPPAAEALLAALRRSVKKMLTQLRSKLQRSR